MNNEVSKIVAKIKNQYENIDTILLFGSATSPDWTNKSDIDVFLVDDSFNDSRSDAEIDGVLVEFQEDSFANIKKDMENERGRLLNRNVSTMIATSTVVSTKSPEKVEELVNFAKEILASKPNYDDEDIKMWKYSIDDYLAKAEKDVARNDEVAFYFDAHYVLQNALEMSLALNGAYMPQPKYLAGLLVEKDPELLEIWKNYLASSAMSDKLTAITALKNK
ncbi:nucleotidyltransferase domain-containing protein [Candidatus Saccharibacteria bacterium]|nr:nucleotidyltransferase domain-containing protein [Candidatus Saccharibacteria bacterium]